MYQSFEMKDPREAAVPADNVNNGLYGQDILSVKQFNRELLTYIMGVADEMRALVRRFGKANLLDSSMNPAPEPAPRSRPLCSGWAAASSPSTRCATPL